MNEITMNTAFFFSLHCKCRVLCCQIYELCANIFSTKGGGGAKTGSKVGWQKMMLKFRIQNFRTMRKLILHWGYYFGFSLVMLMCFSKAYFSIFQEMYLISPIKHRLVESTQLCNPFLPCSCFLNKDSGI